MRYLGQIDETLTYPDTSSVDYSAIADTGVFAPTESTPVLIPTGAVYGPTAVVGQPGEGAAGLDYGDPAVIAALNAGQSPFAVSQQIAAGKSTVSVPSLVTSGINAVKSVITPRPSPTVSTAMPSYFTQSSLVSGFPNWAILAGLVLAVPVIGSLFGGRRR